MSTIAPLHGCATARRRRRRRRDRSVSSGTRPGPRRWPGRRERRRDSSRSSTKYGPSVCAGVSTHAGMRRRSPPAAAPIERPPSSSAPAPPIARSASRRRRGRRVGSIVVHRRFLVGTVLAAGANNPHLESRFIIVGRRLFAGRANPLSLNRARVRSASVNPCRECPFVLLLLHAYVGARLLPDLPSGVAGTCARRRWCSPRRPG